MRQKIKMTEGTPVSRVSETSQRLADLSLAVEEGEHLGAETELLEQLGVSRPTLRQAAKIVEADRLIAVRKGPGGGFFASRPSAADVIRAPARYLRLQGASLMDVHVVTRLIASEAASLAAACSCEEQREILKLHRDAVATTSHDDDTPETTIQQETRLARILSDMSGNPAIALFMEIGYTFGREEQNVKFYQHSDDRSRSRKLQVQLCDAILAHDADIAQVLMARRTEMIVEWITK